MSHVRFGVLAVSRDILTELGVEYGDRVFLTGYGMFEVHDTMNKRYRRRVDIWMADTRAAYLHGVRTSQLMWFGKGEGDAP
jgi:3D (Asp-Asp-Asp) domain-containing protein